MTIEMEYANIIENFKQEYTNLIKEFLRISKPRIEEAGSNVLDDLKKHYSSLIKSPRTSDYISNIEGLLRVLEKRNELSYDNIAPLVYIESRYVRHTGLALLLKNYEERMNDRPVVPIFNIYDLPSALRHQPQPGISGHGTSNDGSQRHQIRAQMTLYNTTEPTFRITLPGTVGIGPSEQNSREEDAEIARTVLLEVSEKLGRHWRNVARFLGVTEYDIDEIDYHSQLPMKEKAFKALLKFQSKCDPSQWKLKLQRALEKARRRDLMEMVEELSSRKYSST